MTYPAGKRNTIPGIAAALIVATIIAVFWLSCGKNETTGATTTTQTTSTTTAKPVSTQTQTTGTVPTTSQDISESPDEIPAGSTPGYGTQDAGPVPLQIISQIVSPEIVAPGGSLTISCTVQGNASSVLVLISKKMDKHFHPVCYKLTKEATDGNKTYWRTTISVPPQSETGLFAFNTSATDSSGTTVQYQIGQGPYDGPGFYFQVQ